MKPTFLPHSTFQETLFHQLRLHYSGGILVLHNKDWPLIAKLWMTDLSRITTLLEPFYEDSQRGSTPRDPASMLRSYLLNLLARPELSTTKWVCEMHRVPLYAILSGFTPGDVPGVGTFYDFFPRLWAAEKKHLSSTIKSKKTRAKKPKKGKKGGKSPRKPGRVERLMTWMLPRLNQKKPLPTDRLFHFFQSEILAVSARFGLLDDGHEMNVAGDGMPVVTSARPRSKSLCDCRAQGLTACNCPRSYSQPDCDIGWDSSRERYFSGYGLYMINACNSQHDLPLYPRLHPASRHDAINFVLSSVEFAQRFTLGTVDKILLDAAHDADAIYQLIVHQGQQPIIDLNKRTKRNLETDSDIRISPDGIPICPKGKEMKPNGYDKSQDRYKWRCSPDCACSTAKYGRTFHTHSKDNLRLFPKIARGTKQWKKIYNRRTSIERSNKREKIDYHLEAGKHRSTMMWAIRIYGIMICQHMDAWFVHQQEELQGLKDQLFPAA